jgi:hypothetical protein
MTPMHNFNRHVIIGSEKPPITGIGMEIANLVWDIAAVNEMVYWIGDVYTISQNLRNKLWSH